MEDEAVVDSPFEGGGGGDAVLGMIECGCCEESECTDRVDVLFCCCSGCSSFALLASVECCSIRGLRDDEGVEGLIEAREGDAIGCRESLDADLSLSERVVLLDPFTTPPPPVVLRFERELPELDAREDDESRVDIARGDCIVAEGDGVLLVDADTSVVSPSIFDTTAASATSSPSPPSRWGPVEGLVTDGLLEVTVDGSSAIRAIESDPIVSLVLPCGVGIDAVWLLLLFVFAENRRVLAVESRAVTNELALSGRGDSEVSEFEVAVEGVACCDADPSAVVIFPASPPISCSSCRSVTRVSSRGKGIAIEPSTPSIAVVPSSSSLELSLILLYDNSCLSFNSGSHAMLLQTMPLDGK